MLESRAWRSQMGPLEHASNKELLSHLTGSAVAEALM